MHLGKHLLEQSLERPVLGTLVELADEVAACLERVACEGEGGFAEILFGGGKKLTRCVSLLVCFICLVIPFVSPPPPLSTFIIHPSPREVEERRREVILGGSYV